jgi:hypothetical protein
VIERELEQCQAQASPSAADKPRHGSRRIAWGVVGLWLAWSALVLGIYYLQLWRLVLYGGWFLPEFHGSLRLPYFGEAALRGASATFAGGLLVLSACLLGLGLFRLARWYFGGLAEALPFAASAGLGVYAFAGLALAVAGLYRPNALVILATLPLLIAGVLLLRRGLRWKFQWSPGPAQLTQWSPGSALAALRRSLPAGCRDRLWAALALLAMGMALVAALAPEVEYDALWYHLQYPRLYLENGRLVDDLNDYVSLYPMTWELWFGYGLALGGAAGGGLTSGAAQTAATLLHYAALPLVALALFNLARLAAPGVSPWLAVVLFATIPTVMWEASTAYIDLALALHTTLALYALLRYGQSRRKGWLTLAAANLGLALATKHLALFVLALASLGLLLVLRPARSHNAAMRSTSGGISAPASRPWPLSVLPALLFLILTALLLALPWYLRSYLASGNPVFPELFWLFGAPPERWDALTQAGLDEFLHSFGRPRTFLNLVTLPWHMTVHAASYHGSLGPLFLIALPLLLFGFIKWKPGRLSHPVERIRSSTGPTAFQSLSLTQQASHGAAPGSLWASSRGQLPWLGGLALLYLALWASPISSFQLRFLVPIAPVLALLAAAALTRLFALGRLAASGRPTLAKTLPKGLVALSAVLLFLNLPPFTSLHEHDRAGWDGWLNSVLHGVEWGVVAGAESRHDYLSRKVRSYPVWDNANKTLPEDARVLAWSGGDQFYSRRERIWAYATSARPAAWAGLGPDGDPAALLPALQELDITHLIADRDFRERLEGAPGWQDRFERLYEDWFYTLYRVRWEVAR